MNEFGAALQAFVQQDWPKGKKDRAWLERADRSREALASFWDATRSTLWDCLSRSSRAKEEVEYDIGMTRFASRPSHNAHVEADRRASLKPREDNPTAATESLLRSLKQIDIESTKSGIIRNANLLINKAVKKRRGLQGKEADCGDIEQQPEASLTNVEGSCAMSQVEVNPESLRFFDKSFVADAAAKASLQWQQFVAALVDIGCSATQSSGSAVMFQHEL